MADTRTRWRAVPNSPIDGVTEGATDRATSTRGRALAVLVGAAVAILVLVAPAFVRETEPTGTSASDTAGPEPITVRIRSEARPALAVGLSDGSAAVAEAPADPSEPGSSTPSETGPATATGTAAGERFETLPPGSTLPTGVECATRVRPTPERVPENTPYNRTPGHAVSGTYLSINTAIVPNDYEQRLDGNFVGTTDEIIQWASCKWGFDEDILRAQVYAESTWYAGKLGDCGERTHERTDGCSSVGLIQVRSAEASDTHHPGVYPIALDSTAMNLDYAMAVKRLCYEGMESWLAEAGSYGPGDEWNCLGRWFSGSWADGQSQNYQRRVRDILAERSWEGPYVGCPGWRDNFHCR